MACISFQGEKGRAHSLVTLDSSHGEYYFKRAYCEGNLSLKNYAVRDYEKAASFKYEAADAYKNIALTAMEVDEDSIALVYFNKGIKVDPDKFKDSNVLIETCKRQIEFHKTAAWKEFEKNREGNKQRK